MKELFKGLTEQEASDKFVRICGSVKADRLQQIWNNSNSHGTQYDKDFKTGNYVSKEEDFRTNAKREGFSDRVIDVFLQLP